MSAPNVYHLEVMVEETNSRSQMPLSSLFRLECHSMAISKSATAIGGLTVMRSSEKPPPTPFFSGTMAMRSRFFNRCRIVRKLRDATVTLRSSHVLRAFGLLVSLSSHRDLPELARCSRTLPETAVFPLSTPVYHTCTRVFRCTSTSSQSCHPTPACCQ